MEKKTVQVQIFGLEYALKSDSDEDYVRSLARFVDEKIRQLWEATSVKSQTKVAVLAALNIADELFQLMRKYHALKRQLEQYEQKSKELSQSIDSKLSELSELSM